MTDLFFCPERWETDPMVSTNIAEQVRVKGFLGKPVDAWQLADWNGSWTAIVSKIPIEKGWLESGCDYRFCFWLNGGENARADETCMLEIWGDDWEERLQFKLNREHTKPLLEKNSWLLFAVPFTAPAAAEALTFRFVVSGAVCTVAGIPAMNMSACEQLSPDVRSFDQPQRHNIVYPNGWPEEQRRKVVLKSPRGREISFSRRALGVAAAIGAFAAVTLIYSHNRKRKS